MLNDLHKNLGVIGQLGLFAPLNEEELDKVIELKEQQEFHLARLAMLRKPIKANLSYSEKCYQMANAERQVDEAEFYLEAIETKAKEITKAAWSRMKASLKRSR